MTKYKDYRIFDEKPRWVIVEDGKIINDNPTKEELICFETEPYKNKIIRRIRYTDDELLEFLIKFYEDTGRSPEVFDFNNNPKYPSYSTYQRRFGSWNNTLKMAGLLVNRFTMLTDDELLEFLTQFYEENGRPPVLIDFINNPEYPGTSIYIRRFGSWSKALKRVRLDVDSMSRKGIVETNQQKGRLFEIFILEHFSKKGVIDVSGDNCTNPFDGICPKGQIYDAKSAGLTNGRFWNFILDKGEVIDYYILGAFNSDYSELMYVWIIPADFIEGRSTLYISLHNYQRGGHNTENMKEHDVTDEYKDIFNDWINNRKNANSKVLREIKS